MKIWAKSGPKLHKKAVKGKKGKQQQEVTEQLMMVASRKRCMKSTLC